MSTQKLSHEEKAVICDLFTRLRTPSKHSNAAIARAIGTQPSYMSHMITKTHLVPDTAVKIMGMVYDECNENEWTLDEWIDKKGKPVPKKEKAQLLPRSEVQDEPITIPIHLDITVSINMQINGQDLLKSLRQNLSEK